MSSSLWVTLRKSPETGLVILVCTVDSVTIAYDGSLMGSLNVMPSYTKYFTLTTSTTAVNTCATFLGAILIGPVTGKLIDWKGRKMGIYAAAIVNIIGAIVAATAHNIAAFIAGRLIIGIGVGLGQTAAGTYVSETTAPAVRPFALGLYFSCWAIGSLLAASISYGASALEPSNWAWRIPSAIQGVAPLLAMMILFFLPESPRWLAHNGRQEEAIDILAKINGKDKDDHGVQLQWREILDAVEYEEKEGKSMGFREASRTKPNRKRVMLALSIAPISMLTGSNIITYYFGSMLSQAGISSSHTQLEINVILQVWQLACAVAGSCLAERLGRRALALISLGTCSLFFYLLAGLTAKYGEAGSKSGTYGTVAVIFLFLGSYAFGITPLTAIYAPEVLSYNIRATGMAMQGMFIKTCGVFVTMVFPYMMRDVGWKSYIINASWNILFWLYIYFQWVETKGKTLEEIDAVFGVEHLSGHRDPDNMVDGVDIGNLKNATGVCLQEHATEHATVASK